MYEPSDPSITSGDPLAAGSAPAGPPAPGGYGGSPVPPGASSPGAFRPTPTPFSAGQHVLSEWWRRAVALIIDSIIIGVAALIILAIFGGIFSVGFLGGETAGVISTIVGLLLGVVAVAVVALVYAPLMMVRTNGQTLGKMATGCRVVRADGKKIDFGWAALREVVVKALAFGVAGSITFGIANLLDYLWPLWDDQNRALHDMVVNSRVVRT